MSAPAPPFHLTPEWLRAEAASWRETFGLAGEPQAWAFEVAADTLADRLALVEAVTRVFWDAEYRSIPTVVASLARYGVEATPSEVLATLEGERRFARDIFYPHLWGFHAPWRHHVELVGLIEAYLTELGEPQTLTGIVGGLPIHYHHDLVDRALRADDRFVFEPIGDGPAGSWRLRRPEDPS